MADPDVELPSPQAWLAAFAAELGTEPLAPEDIEVLLELAGVAAHASARQAAPVACYLVGRVGVTPADALAAARRTTA